MTSPVEQVTSAGPAVGRLHFARYLGAALLARTADEGARVGLVVLAVDRTGSAVVAGTLVATLLVPHVVAAPFVGALIDRSRRPGAVLAGAIAIFASGLAAAAGLLGRSPLWVTYAVLAFAGCGGPAITGGLTSRVPGLVGAERSARAFGWDSLFYNLASMAGPAAVAVVAVTAGPATAVMALAAAAALGAVGVATLRLRGAPAADRRRPDLMSGVRAIAVNPALRCLTVTSSAGQIGLGGLAVVVTTLAATRHRPEVGGLLLTAVAGGALVGSLVWTWRPLAPDRALDVTAWSMIGTGAALTAAATTATTDSLPLTGLLFGVAGFCVGPFAAALFLARDLLAPEAVRAQVFTIGAGMKVTASALGAGLIGFAGSASPGAQLLLVAASPVLAGVAGAVYAIRSRRVA